MTTNLRIPKVEKDKKHDHKLKKMKSRQRARTIANLRTWRVNEDPWVKVDYGVVLFNTLANFSLGGTTKNHFAKIIGKLNLI